MLSMVYKRKSIPPFGAAILNKSIVLRNILDSVKGLEGWTHYEPIVGGAMNSMYKVFINKKPRVLRILSFNPYLKMNRRNEVHNLNIASKMKIAPKLIDYDFEKNIIVTEYIEGSTVTNKDLANKYFTFKVIDKMKELHEGPRFLDDLNCVDMFNKYYSQCIGNDYKLPRELKRKLKYINQIGIFLNNLPKLSVPCHGDLWAPNIILTKNDEIKFIDFEFSGNSDPLYDIAVFWNDSDLSLDILQDIIRNYYGNYCFRKTCIAELYSIYINCMWVAWATIQKNTSKIKYDYDSFIDEKLNKALPKLNKKYINNLLDNII